GWSGSIIRPQSKNHRQGGSDHEIICRVLTCPDYLQFGSSCSRSNSASENEPEWRWPAAKRNNKNLSGPSHPRRVRHYGVHDLVCLLSWRICAEEAGGLRELISG